MTKKKTGKTEKDEVKTAAVPETPKEKVSAEPKKVKSPKKAKTKKKAHGQSYQKQTTKVNANRLYPLAEAIRLAKETAYAKFDASLEAHFNLGLDVSRDDQKIRATTVLPHGTGKVKRILAFVSLETAAAARQAGADLIGDEKKIEETAQGKIDFDVVVAEPSFMPKLSKVARILGPKGLMPNPKSGTVSADPVRAISELKKGRVELKTETNAPLLHTTIGKKSFEDQALVENFLAVYNTLKAAKPAKTKGVFIQSISLSPTMGPGIKVDLTSLG